MSNPFQQWLAFVWRPDFDGQGYHVTDHDTGVGTAWGVIEATWSEAQQMELVHGPLSDAPQSACGAVLRSLFWDKCRCDEMHPAVGGVVFNMAMSDGPARAAKILQAAIGVDSDGVIGPVTLAAANSVDPHALVLALTACQENFTAGLSSAKWFGNGWKRRAEAARAFAETLLQGPVPA
jgi:lysozyme family protein